MISQYIQAALRHATYSWLDEDKIFYGEIPLLQGVYSTGTNLEDCRDSLKEVLEDYILVSLRMNLPLPVIDEISLEVRKAA